MSGDQDREHKVEIVDFQMACPMVDCHILGAHSHFVCLECQCVMHSNPGGCRSCCEYRGICYYCRFNLRDCNCVRIL